MTAVNFDPRDTDYGLIAREVLALATGGTLHVRGIEDATPSDAMFYDDGGLPVFVVSVTSPLALAAGDERGAVLAIPADPESSFTQLVLAGDLCVLDSSTCDVDDEDEDGDGDGHVPNHVASVALLVHTVVLERDAAESPTVSYRTVAIDNWRGATPDPMRPVAQRIVAHTNHTHAAQLRDYVADLRNIATGDVIAAELRGLDAHGVDLHWVDGRGAHRARLCFDEPAGCPGELASALRGALRSP